MTIATVPIRAQLNFSRSIATCGACGALIGRSTTGIWFHSLTGTIACHPDEAGDGGWEEPTHAAVHSDADDLACDCGRRVGYNMAGVLIHVREVCEECDGELDESGWHRCPPSVPFPAHMMPCSGCGWPDCDGCHP